MQESTDMAICLPCMCRMHKGHGVCLGHSCMRAFFFLNNQTLLGHGEDTDRTQRGGEKKNRSKNPNLNFLDLLISLLLLVSHSQTDLLLLLFFFHSCRPHLSQLILLCTLFLLVCLTLPLLLFRLFHHICFFFLVFTNPFSLFCMPSTLCPSM